MNVEIKEVENLLSISRSNIRFYEKQGLISPERRNNNYRDYSEEDVSELKKIIILRKMGFTVEEILKIKNGGLSFSDAVPNAKTRLETEIEQLNGALKIIKQVEKEHTSFDGIDVNKYWDSIAEAEKDGEKFIDICKDYMKLLESNIRIPPFQNFNFREIRNEYGIVKAVMFILSISLAGGVSKVLFHTGSFWYGLIYPWIIALAAGIILFPVYLLSRKSPKIGKIVATVILFLCCAFILSLIILIVFLVIRSIIL